MGTETIIAAFVASIGAMLFGGLWYSPLMFEGPWKRLSAIPEDAQQNPASTYGGAFVLLLLGALVFGAFIGPSPSLGFALGAGVSAGVAWAAGSLWISYLFEGRPLKLGLINGGYHIGQYALFGLTFGLI